MRALSEAVEGLDVHFVGNAPSAHFAAPDGSTTFFMRACFLGGKFKAVPNVSQGAERQRLLRNRALTCARRLGLGVKGGDRRVHSAGVARADGESALRRLVDLVTPSR